MKKIKALVIYDMIPEETIKAIVEMTEDEYAYFKFANDVIINSHDNDENGIEACNAIGNALCSNPEFFKHCETDTDEKYFGKWVSSIVEKIEDIESVSKFISCGIYI